MIAAYYGSLGVSQELLNHHADLNVCDEYYGESALFKAAERGHSEICKLLVHAGADINTRNKDQRTAEDIADDYGHSLLAEWLREIRYKQDVRKIGKAAGKAIKEADLPVKLFVVGPTEAGKTTIVRSIFNYLSKQELPRAHGFRSSTETVDSFWKTKHITADNLERTVGLVILRTRIAEDIFAIIYDLGGHETYYSLQAIFLHLENGFFLITIDVKQSEEHILEEVQKHLTVLSSKLPKGTTSEAVLAFTHFDLLEENKIGKKMLICKRARLNKFENIKIIGEVFIDAQDGDSKEFHKLMDLCKKMAQDVKSCMRDDVKTIPRFLIPVLKALNKESERLKKNLLDWCEVLPVVKKTVLKHADEDISGLQVLQMCFLLNNLGMVLVADPDSCPIADSFDWKMYENKMSRFYLVCNLTWFLGDFLGILFSPDSLLKSPSICSNGFISAECLMIAFEHFNVDEDKLICILDHFGVIIKKDVTESGDCMYLIPSLLMNEKDPKWLTWESSRECPYFHMFGRICKLDRTMNPSTLPKIQHDLVKKFDKSMKSSILFQNGIFMEWDKCNILVELKSFHSVASVKIALSIDASSNDNINEILRYLKDSGKYLDSIFTNVVCGAADKQNPSTNLKRMVISLEEMREGTDSVTYDLDDILRRFGDNHKVIKSNSETAKEADCILPLLTASEIKMQRHLTEDVVDSQLKAYVIEKMQGGTRKGVLRIGDLLVFETEELGRGAQSIIFRGKFGAIDLAIKRVEKKRYSVQEEHEKLKRMEHPSIVKYFEIKQHGEFMYLALEVCDSDLDDYIKTKAPSQTPRNLIDLFKQIALGIQYLHQENLIHRDIKPSNILVKEYKSGSCQPKLCDFGCAKQLEDGRIDYTDSLNRGSQGFVPQELLNEDFLQKVLQTIGKAADVFPLGCILHMLLSTGKHPFGDPVDRNSNIKHMKQAIIEIKLIHEAGIANEAEDLVARMIDHDPKERPNIEEVLQHPIFWSNKNKMDMIYNVSEKIPNPLQMDPDTQNLLTELSNILSTNVAGSRWCDELPVAPMRPGWGVSPIQKPPVKAFNPTQPEISMLRFIRNIWAHKQRNIQAGLWRDEDEMSKVFSTAFHGFV